MTRRRAWGLVLVAAVLAGLGLAGTVLPDAGLRYGLTEALRRLGMVEVSVSETDLSLFGGNIVIKRMVARPPSGSAWGLDGLALQFRWRPLLDKRLAVDEMALDGLDIDVRRAGAGWVVNGLPLAVQGGGDGKPWTLDVVSLRLGRSRLTFTDGDLMAVVDIDTLEVANLRSWDPQAAARYLLKGRINGAPVTIEGTALPFAGNPAFQLRLVLERLDLAAFAKPAAALGMSGLKGLAGGALTLSGGLDGVRAEGQATWSAADAAIAGTRIEAATLRWTGSATGTEASGRLEGEAVAVADKDMMAKAGSLAVDLSRLRWGGGGFAWQGAAQAESLQATAGGAGLAAPAASWRGNLAVDAKGGVRAEGRLEAEEPEASHDAFALSQRRLAVEGSIALGEAPGGSIRLVSEGVALRQPDIGFDWLAAERIEATELRPTAEGGVAAGRVSLRGLGALRRTGRDAPFPWRAEARELRLDKPVVAADGAAEATAATAAGLVLRLTRTKAGFLGIPTSTAPAEATALPRLALGRLSVEGGRLAFEDRTTPEPVRLELQPLALSLSNLDSDAPDRDSPFRLRAQAGEASVAADGLLRPFATPLSGSLKGEVKALELPPLSPYAAEALGVHLQTGHFDGRLRASLDRRVIDGNVTLVLSNLFVEQGSADAPIARKVEMPIETVLDLLRDGDDRIHLDIPVSGSLDDLRFDVSDAVNQAIGGALKSTALTTLKVIFPVAAIVGMVIDADQKARLALPALPFAAGADTLAEGQRTRLAAVAGLMKSRPALKLRLCGKADATDWPALESRRRAAEGDILGRLQRLVGGERKAASEPPDHEALTALAARRGAAAKEELVDHAGIEPGRLFECRPEVEAAAGAGPRVELLL